MPTDQKSRRGTCKVLLALPLHPEARKTHGTPHLSISSPAGTEASLTTPRRGWEQELSPTAPGGSSAPGGAREGRRHRAGSLPLCCLKVTRRSARAAANPAVPPAPSSSHPRAVPPASAAALPPRLCPPSAACSGAALRRGRGRGRRAASAAAEPRLGAMPPRRPPAAPPRRPPGHRRGSARRRAG